MDKKTQGAWVIHHSQKLQSTQSQDFDNLGFAGKCGVLLSAISGGKQFQLANGRLNALAKANKISPRTELPAILSELSRQKLISVGQSGIETLGLTAHSVLEHTAGIFQETTDQPHEMAVVELSEIASTSPVKGSEATEYISDTFKLTADDARNTIDLGKGIGFFDSEAIANNDSLLFNGNLFRRDDAQKVSAILGSLNNAESGLVVELNQKLGEAGCISLNSAQTILGVELFSKLHSIGMFDVSVVGNEQGKNYFVTRPAAFSKFSTTIADDALDLAKAFVASLTYGMTVSSYYRGRIQAISLLMKKLIAGGEVGPATAIGSDYQALEHRGVVEVRPAHGGMFIMKLLKPEVGRLALSVIEEGDITAEAIAQLPGARVTEYINPERSREVERRNASPALKSSARNLLNEIRKGGLSR